MPPKEKVDKLVNVEGKKAATKASQAKVTTRFAFKAAVQPFDVLTTINIGSSFVALFTAPSIIPSIPTDAPSYRKAIVSTKPLKRKDVPPNSSATSSKLCSSYTLIENLDMGDLLEGFAINHVHNQAYIRIQDVLAMVRALYHSYCDFHCVSHDSSTIFCLGLS